MRASLERSVFVAGQHPAIPKAKRVAIRAWNIIAVLVVLGGIVYAFFGGWYWALIGIVVGFIIANANRTTAAGFVVETATTNVAFKKEMVERGIIVDQ